MVSMHPVFFGVRWSPLVGEKYIEGTWRGRKQRLYRNCVQRIPYKLFVLTDFLTYQTVKLLKTKRSTLNSNASKRISTASNKNSMKSFTKTVQSYDSFARKIPSLIKSDIVWTRSSRTHNKFIGSKKRGARLNSQYAISLCNYHSEAWSSLLQDQIQFVDLLSRLDIFHLFLHTIWHFSKWGQFVIPRRRK